jgi:hypothetical protein
MKVCCEGNFTAYGSDVCNPKPVFNKTETVLREAEFNIKTTEFKYSTIVKIKELKEKMTKPSGKGYC